MGIPLDSLLRGLHVLNMSESLVFRKAFRDDLVQEDLAEGLEGVPVEGLEGVQEVHGKVDRGVRWSCGFLWSTSVV